MAEHKSIVELWQGQPLIERKLDMGDLIENVDRFQRKIRRRNVLEYTAACVLVIWAILFVARSDALLLIKAGVLLIALGGLGAAIILRLRGHGAEGKPPVASTTRDVLLWHRSELSRQRDLLRSVPVWYLGPFVPGLVLLLVGAWLAHPDKWLRISLSGALVLVVFTGVAFMNLKAARKLGEQIDAVGREIEGSELGAASDQTGAV